MLMGNRTQNQRPRVTDYQPPAPEFLQQMREEERVKNAIKLIEEDTPSYKCSPDLFKRLSNILYDIGRDYYHYDEKSEELRFLRFIDGHLKNRLISGLDDEARLEFGNFIENVNKLCKELFEKQIADTKAMVQADLDNQKTVENAEKLLRENLSEIRAEKALIQQEKNRKPRIFSDAEKARCLHWQAWAEDDLNRSKQNLLDKKISIKKEIKGLEKEIAEFDKNIIPHFQNIEGLQKQLETDLPEDEFKNVKLSLEYNQAQIAKIQNKILPLTEQNTKLYNEIDEIDRQLKLLDICIDKEALMKDAKLNFPRRKERLLFRVEKHLKEQTEIENLRNALNLRWAELTGDCENLIQPLGLKAENTLYFI